MAHCGAHASRALGAQRGQAGLGRGVPALGETLDVPVAHHVPGVGVKAGQGERIAQPVDRPAQQGHGLLAQLQPGLAGSRHRVAQRLRKVEQYQHRDAAPVRTVAHQDARVGLRAGAPVDQGPDRHVQIEFAALVLVADADPVLGLQQVEQLLQLARQCVVALQHGIDQAGIAAGCRAS